MMGAWNAWSEHRMSAIHHLKLPLKSADVRMLRAGDLVYLDGEIVATAGFPTHQRLMETITGVRELPFALDGAAFFHLGSYITEDAGGIKIEYINPTTSTRFNDLMPTLIRRFDLRLVGGKGGLDTRSVEAMRETGCAYLSFLGGGAPLHSAAIQRVVDVGWSDLVSHFRLLKLDVRELGPLTVAIDAHGASLYDELSARAHSMLPDVIKSLKR
jgi:fumarate hydratase subunit beta